jgi:hypothetical protein
MILPPFLRLSNGTVTVEYPLIEKETLPTDTVGHVNEKYPSELLIVPILLSIKVISTLPMPLLLRASTILPLIATLVSFRLAPYTILSRPTVRQQIKMIMIDLR